MQGQYWEKCLTFKRQLIWKYILFRFFLSVLRGLKTFIMARMQRSNERKCFQNRTNRLWGVNKKGSPQSGALPSELRVRGQAEETTGVLFTHKAPLGLAIVRVSTHCLHPAPLKIAIIGQGQSVNGGKCWRPNSLLWWQPINTSDWKGACFCVKSPSNNYFLKKC